MMRKGEMPTNCPLCGRQPSGVIHSFSLAEVAEAFTSRALGRDRFERMTEILAGMWRVDRVNVMRCDPCGFGYADPFVAGTAEFYRLEAPDTPYPRDKWEYEQTLRCLADWPAEHCTLLDIGAGKGHFEARLLERGWKPGNLRATEFSFAGKDAIERLGVECRAMRREEPGRGQDAVRRDLPVPGVEAPRRVRWSVRGSVAARQARTLHLFVAVPNGARIAFNEESGLQYDYPPNHVSRWSPRSFQILADKYGWRLEGCKLEPEPTMLGEAVYGAVNRFIRQSYVPGAWARTVFAAAGSKALHGKANRLVKGLGLMVSPDAWLAAARVAYAAREPPWRFARALGASAPRALSVVARPSSALQVRWPAHAGGPGRQGIRLRSRDPLRQATGRHRQLPTASVVR